MLLGHGVQLPLHRLGRRGTTGAVKLSPVPVQVFNLLYGLGLILTVLSLLWSSFAGNRRCDSWWVWGSPTLVQRVRCRLVGTG